MASLTERYLTEFKDELRLPTALKTRVLAEVTDHLHEALSDELVQGLEAKEAEQRVLQRFGGVKEVAESFLLDSVASETYLAGKALFATEVALIVFSFLRAHTQPPGPWSQDILPAPLTFFVNIATFAFFIALLGSFFVCWRLWFYRTRPLPVRALPLILSVALFNVLSLLVDGICYNIFLFQRATVVPHSSSLLVLLLITFLELSLILGGSFFVLRAALRYIVLRKMWLERKKEKDG